MIPDEVTPEIVIVRRDVPRPSITQREALMRMVAGRGTITRHEGGFWTTPETKTVRREGYTAPVWYVVLSTVRAMEKRGWVARVNVREDWADDRVITDAGRAAIR